MRFSLTAATLLALLLAGCAAPTGKDRETTPPVGTETGYFIDGPLQGLHYETTSGKAGVTDGNGAFRYDVGDTVSFLLGGQTLGSPVAGAKTITPLTLVGATALDESEAGVAATNLIRLFLALDDGSNPYGLTIPESTHESLEAALGGSESLNELLASGDFAAEAQALLDEADLDTGSELPEADAAKGHWDLSEQLTEALEGETEDNLTVAVRIPEGYEGSILKLNYKAETLLPGMTQYVSGTQHTVTAGDNGIVVFTGKLHSSHWQLNLSLFRDDEKVAEGDLLTFYHADGFSQDLPSGYDLDMTGGARVLQADLSSGSAVVVETVHTVSGHLYLAKELPNGDDLKESAHEDVFWTFNTLLNNNTGVAMISVTLPLADVSAWTVENRDNPSTSEVESIPCYSIPFSTTLPAGYAYTLQSYYRNHVATSEDPGNGDYDTYSFDSTGPLNADVTDIELADPTWEEY